MPKMIKYPCPECKGAHLITMPDGRGKPCPRCNMEGYILVEVETVTDCMLNKAIRENYTPPKWWFKDK